MTDENGPDIQEKRIRKLEERDKDKQAAIDSAFKHLEPFARSDAVPIAELEQLAAEWEEDQQKYPDHGPGKHASAAVRCCAEELRELIAEYGDRDA